MEPRLIFIALCVFTTSHLADSYITRLPNRIHGRFDVKVADLYVTGGLVTSVVRPINETECILLCVTDSVCEFINHKADESQCELMQDLTSATKEASVGWNYLSTNQTTRNEGQYCQIMDPCPFSQKCHDDESEKGYACTDPENVALNKAVSCATGTIYYAPHAVNNEETVKAYCTHISQYMRIDLGQSFTIDFVTVWTKQITAASTHDLELHIGDDPTKIEDTTLCFSKWNPMPVKERAIVCTTDIPGQKAFKTGRYVFLSWVGAIPEDLKVDEIRVFKKV